MRRIFDVTLPFSNRLPAWPGEGKPSIRLLSSIKAGATANVTRMETCVHYGTHVDAPCHFLDGGADAASLSLDSLIGPCAVVVIDDREITPEHLEAADIEGVERVLFKTANSNFWNEERPAFVHDYVALVPEAARWLVRNTVRLVGIDYLSIERFGEPDHVTHRTLLRENVVIVEGLDLRAVEPGRYELACLPLKLAEGDGAPARVVLIQEDDS